MSPFKLKKNIILSLYACMALHQCNAADLGAEKSVHTPVGFAEFFKSKSLQAEKLAKDESFVLQVGVIYPNGEGDFFRFNGAESKIALKQVAADGSITSLDQIPMDKDFEKLINSMIVSAPIDLVQIDEAFAISHNLSGKIWLFEYIDPLGGKISIITVEGLPGPHRVRNHAKMNIAFKKIKDRFFARPVKS